MAISIVDLGDRRRLSVGGTQWDGSAYTESELSIETILSAETLWELTRVNGEDWVINDVRRTELPGYIERPIHALLRKFPTDSVSPRFLDFGCGTGQSTVAIARAGFEVVGIDRDAKLLKPARMRVVDYGLDKLASFIDTPATAELPFEAGSFDAVVASGVFEHIPLQERKQFATECWRMLRPGGVFYVVGSPNRLWPVESHTSGLPLVHWIPLSVAERLIHRCSRNAARGWDRNRLVDGGLYGVSLMSLLRWIPGSRLLVADGGNIPFYFGVVWDPGKGSAVRRLGFGMIRFGYRVAEFPLRWAGVPVEAFFPYTHVAIQKDMGA